jgi:hypothetical protein
MKQQLAHIGAFVAPEQRQHLVARAREEDRSVSAVIRRALHNYLATPPPGTIADVLAEAADLQERAMSKGAS